MKSSSVDIFYTHSRVSHTKAIVRKMSYQRKKVISVRLLTPTKHFCPYTLFNSHVAKLFALDNSYSATTKIPPRLKEMVSPYKLYSHMFVTIEQFKQRASEYICEINTCDSLRWECPSLRELLYMLCHYNYAHAKTQQEIKASVLMVFEQIGILYELGKDVPDIHPQLYKQVNMECTTCDGEGEEDEPCPCTIEKFDLLITLYIQDVRESESLRVDCYHERDLLIMLCTATYHNPTEAKEMIKWVYSTLKRHFVLSCSFQVY